LQFPLGHFATLCRRRAGFGVRLLLLVRCHRLALLLFSARLRGFSFDLRRG